jgi:N-acetylmuramoyl-L-alanine amidase
VRTIDLVVVHCSDSSWGDAAAIRKWHTDPVPKGRGWADIGYHYVLLNGHRDSRRVYYEADDGLLERGREEAVPGAHVEGHNAHSIGVCLVGPDFTDTQKAAAARLVADLCQRYALDPAAQVKGHREMPHVQKQCPLIDMSEFRSAVVLALHPSPNAV